jgi:hypothetical protein
VLNGWPVTSKFSASEIARHFQHICELQGMLKVAYISFGLELRDVSTVAVRTAF